MPFKAALALALTIVLSAPIALASPEGADRSAPHATHGARHKEGAAKPGKHHAPSQKVAAVGRRKHLIDNKPDTHGVAASIAKPLDVAPKADVKKGETKKTDMKHVGKKREARRADTKKSTAKSGDKKQAVPVVAVAISSELPALPPPAAEASKLPPAPPERTLLARGKKPPKGLCLHEPVHVTRGTEEIELALTKCDGSPAAGAADKMGVMLRPGGTDKPAVSIDAGLVERLGLVTEHFAKAGVTRKISIVSGSRPSSAGSYHASGRAMDFRLDGARNEDVVAFCKTLGDTGCGYYPNSSFVHMDVRDPGTGHVAWIDASGPGEAPRYVSQWPPPNAPASAPGAAPDKKETRAMIEDLLATIEKELPPLAPANPASPKVDAPHADAPVVLAAPVAPVAPADAPYLPAPKADME